MYTPIKRLSRANSVIQQAVASYQRIDELMSIAPQIQEHSQAYPLLLVKGKVKFEMSLLLIMRQSQFFVI